MSTRYTQTEEAEKLERMYNRRTERIAWLVVLLAVGVFGVGYGQHTQHKLVIQTVDNAEYATSMLGQTLDRCVTAAARTMSLVLLENPYLHQTIRELPPIVWKVQP